MEPDQATRDQILRALTVTLSVLFEVSPAEIPEDARLIEEFEADSIDFLDLALALRDEFGIRVDTNDFLDLFTRLNRFLSARAPRPLNSSATEGDLSELAAVFTVGSLADFVLSEASVAPD